jgi:hypothetical protein
MRRITSALSLATCALTAWMFAMYLVLQHPGYLVRAGIAALVFAGATTLVSGRPLPRLRIPIALWGVALAALGVWALASPGDDGWVLIAALLFVAEGSCAIVSSATAA